jgi:hypothetical protein
MRTQARWLADGGYMNHILYAMCQQQPGHDDVEVVRGKIELIGRAYSAAPSRGVTIEGFYRGLADAVVANGARIDAAIAQARRTGRINWETLPEAVEAHRTLSNVIVAFILENRDGNSDRGIGHRDSFSSKYLHFHAPGMFPILDSKVEDALRRRRQAKVYTNPSGRAGERGRYAAYCRHFLSYAETRHDSERWTPRSVDGELWPYPVENTLKAEAKSPDRNLIAPSARSLTNSS